MITGTFTILEDSSAQQSNATNIKNESKPIDFLLYENSTYGIKISYPKNWFVETFQETYPLTSIVTLFSPESSDYVTVSINTYDYSNTQIDTLKELLNDTIAGYSLYPDEFPNFTLISSATNKALDGMPAYIIEGQYQDPNFGKQKTMEIGTVKNGITTFIQYFGTPSQYKHYLPTINIMIKSFDMLPSNK